MAAQATESPVQAPLSILLIEDSVSDARLLQESLREEIDAGNVVVQTVRRLAEGIEALRQRAFSCVLLDLGLPDGQGVANIEPVRSADRNAAIVVLTGLDSDVSARKALQMGAQDYLVKGHHEAGTLLKLVRHAVQRNRQVNELEARRAQELLAASRDPLTGLSNRQFFEERARQMVHGARLTDGLLALCFIDLNGFKAVNDEHGHATGDAVLTSVARIVSESVRETDTVARLGGDEFAILIAPIRSGSEPDELGRRITARIRNLREVNGIPLTLGCSVGIAVFPEHGTSYEELLHAADIAMYHAKGEGGGTRYAREPAAPEPSSEERPAPAPAPTPAEAALRYQPWIDTIRRGCAGVEVQLHATGTGAIGAATWIAAVEQACMQWRAWRDAGLIEGCLALDLDTALLGVADLRLRLVEALARRRTAPSDIDLRVSAGAVREGAGQGLALLRRLRAEGFRIVLARFPPLEGALDLLVEPEFDGLHVDLNSIASAAGSSQLMRYLAAVLAASASLDLPTIVGGVETRDDLAVIEPLHCRFIQGGAVVAAVPAEELPGQLAALHARSA